MDSNNPKPNQNCPATNSITDVINSASALTAPKTTIITSILFSFAIKNRRVLAGFADFFWRRHPDLNLQIGGCPLKLALEFSLFSTICSVFIIYNNLYLVKHFYAIFTPQLHPKKFEYRFQYSILYTF